MSVVEFANLAAGRQTRALAKLTDNAYTLVSSSGGLPRNNNIAHAEILLSNLLKDNLIIFNNEHLLQTFWFNISKVADFLTNTPLICARKTDIYKRLNTELYDLSALIIHNYTPLMTFDPEGPIGYYGASARKDRLRKLLQAHHAGVKIFVTGNKRLGIEYQFVPPVRLFAGIYIVDDFFNKHKNYTFKAASRLYEHALDNVPLLFLKSDIENIHLPPPPRALVYDTFEDMMRCDRDKVQHAFEAYRNEVFAFAYAEIENLLRDLRPCPLSHAGQRIVQLMLDYVRYVREKAMGKQQAAVAHVMYCSFSQSDVRFFERQIENLKKIQLLFA